MRDDKKNIRKRRTFGDLPCLQLVKVKFMKAADNADDCCVTCQYGPLDFPGFS